MMLRIDMEHLPWPMREEIHRVVTMVFEAFSDATKGKLSEQLRQGRIIKLILHGPHAQADWQDLPPGKAIHLLAIVNHPRLARQQQRWHVVRDRLRRAWEFGEIAQPVRLTVHSLARVNHALAEGVPNFVTIATEGIALYEFDRTPLKMPRHCQHRSDGRAGWLNIPVGMAARLISCWAQPSFRIKAMRPWQRCCCIRRANISTSA